MSKRILTFQSKYKTYEVYLKWDTYRSNGRTFLELREAFTHEPVLVASVNLDDAPLEDGEMIIKDYSENEGVLDFLVSNGIVSKPKRWLSTGWVMVPVVDLLVKPI